MKRPTITKLQTINALVELRRQDYEARSAAYRTELRATEEAVSAEIMQVLHDPRRLAAAISATADGRPSVVIDEYQGEASIEFSVDPGVGAAVARLLATQKARPDDFNPSRLTSTLEDKLTGCDPESLLSVPSNVEAMRNLLNGLQLLPLTVEELSDIKLHTI